MQQIVSHRAQKDSIKSLRPSRPNYDAVYASFCERAGICSPGKPLKTIGSHSTPSH